MVAHTATRANEKEDNMQELKKILAIAYRVAVLALLAAILWCIPKPMRCDYCGAEVYELHEITGNDGQALNVCAEDYLLAD